MKALALRGGREGLAHTKENKKQKREGRGGNTKVETSTSLVNDLEQHFLNTSPSRTATSQSSQHASGEVKVQSVALYTQLVRAKLSSCYVVLVGGEGGEGESTGGGTTSKLGPRTATLKTSSHLMDDSQVLLPLRCLLLRRSADPQDRARWQHLLSLETHLETRRHTAVWWSHQAHVDKVTSKFCDITSLL
uniref:Uncharacterized protein n=1 Tax=Timema monikensis TaxID=170555 RepID=A0A7R9EJZ7_9NEOP|nr:unnamed protein product [Timema monikensis]